MNLGGKCAEIVSDRFSDTLVAVLIIGVMLVAFLFVFLLKADFVTAILLIGTITAFIEAGHHRDRK